MCCGYLACKGLRDVSTDGQRIVFPHVIPECQTKSHAWNSVVAHLEQHEQRETLQTVVAAVDIVTLSSGAAVKRCFIFFSSHVCVVWGKRSP